MVVESLLPLSLELGILAGLAVAISGYIQAYAKVDEKGNREKFSIDKFTYTIIIGAVIGGIMAFASDMDYGITLFLVDAGIVAIVGSLIKAMLHLDSAKKNTPKKEEKK